MNSTATRRISTRLGWAAFVVLAWAALALLFSAGTAHADDDTDGPLDAVTSLVGSAIDAGSDVASGVVNKTVAPVIETVAPALTDPAPPTETVPGIAEPATKTIADTVEAIPVVRDVVPPVTHAATGAAEKATTPVTDLLQASPGSHVTDPVLDVVSAVPALGGALEHIGVPRAVTDVTRAVDDAVGAVGRTVGDAVPPILDAVDRAVAPPPSSSPGGAAPDDPASVSDAPGGLDAPASRPVSTAAAASITAPIAPSATYVLFRAHPAPDALDSPGNASAPADSPRAAHAPPGSVAPSSSASLGAGPVGDAARVNDASDHAVHAWHPALRAADDDLPSSPVEETDASPD